MFFINSCCHHPPTMSTSIEDKCQNLWQLLKSKAKVLRPKIIVRGFDDDQLLALCSSDDQKEALEATMDRFSNSKKGSLCSCCHESITEAGGTFASEWDFDFDKKLQILTHLSVCFGLHSILLIQFCVANMKTMLTLCLVSM
jgi:hypothetical protein